MLASLPMYDFPNVRHDTDALWKSIASTLAKQGLNAPEHLARPDDPRTHWQDNDLLFSQTCGFPYVSELQKSVTLIGTPDYGVVPDKPGWYYSIILCRQNDERQHLSDFAGARFAYNATDSQSGCHAMMYTLKEMFDERRHFGPCLLTGGHINSARFVAEGRADIAAIDVVTWLHLKRDEPFTRELRVLMETSPTPQGNRMSFILELS